MIERTIIPCSRRWGRRALEVAITAVAASLVINPGAVRRAVDELLVQAWETAGEAIVDRELTTLAGMLEEDRADLRRAEVLRDALAARLQALQDRRRANGIEFNPASFPKDHPWEFPRTDREVLDLDGAIVALRSTIERADHYIDSARRLVRARETDLCTLQVQSSARRAGRELANLDSVLPHWEGRARLTAELFGSSPPAMQ